MPVTLYNPQTGSPVALSPEEAQKAVSAGALGPQRDQLVPIVLADGRKGTVPGHELSENLANGAKIYDPEAEKHAAEVADESGVVGGARAFTTGVVNGAAGGVGEGLIRKGIGDISPTAGKQFQHDVEISHEAWPNLHTVGNVVGAAGASFLAGRAGGLARLAPAAGIDAVGGLVERGAARAVAGLGGEGALATAARAAAVTAARGAAETALFSAGAQAGEDLLGDHELAAEKIAIAGGRGLLLGGAIGGALGGAGSLVRSGAKASLEGMQGLLHTAADDAAEEGSIKLAAGGDALASGKLLSDAEELRGLAKETKGLNPHDIAAEQAWRAGGGNKALTKEAELRAGGTKAVGETVLREGILQTDQGIFHNTADGLLERTQAAMDRVGKKIEAVVGPSEASVSAGEVLGSLDAAIEKHAQSAFSQVTAESLALSRQRLIKSLGISTLVDDTGALLPQALEKRVSFQDLVKERRALQEVAYNETKTLDPHQRVQALRDVASAWRKLEGEALDNASRASGGPTGEEFRALNKTMQHLYIYEKALEGTIASGHANRAISLSDHIVGKGSAMLGGGVGALVGGPFGAAAGGVASGAVGAIINKMARERGNAAAAVALTRLADIGAVRHMMGTVDRAVDKAAKGLVTTAEKPKVRVVGGSARTREEKPTPGVGARYRDAIEQTNKMQQSDIPGRAAAATQDLAQHAPNTANAYAVHVSRAAAFLATKRPTALTAPGPFTQHDPSVLDTDKSEYLRYFTAVTDPMTVLKDFERGVVTPEAAEALKATSPKLFAELQGKTLAAVAEAKAKGKPLPFRKRMELGLLFDIPTDSAYEPDVFKALQGNVASDPPAAKNAPSSKGPRRPVQLPNTTNPLDRLSQSGPGRK